MAERARWVIKIGSALLTNDGKGLDRALMPPGLLIDLRLQLR